LRPITPSPVTPICAVAWAPMSSLSPLACLVPGSSRVPVAGVARLAGRRGAGAVGGCPRLGVDNPIFLFDHVTVAADRAGAGDLSVIATDAPSRLRAPGALAEGRGG